MNALVPVALVAWLPITLLMFVLMRPRHALIACFVGGWMFLPMGEVAFQGIPNFTKYAAVGVSALLGVLVFDARRLSTFRPHFIDLPMALFLLAPSLSAIANDHGYWEVGSAAVDQVLMWGLPYFLGRVYFTDHEAMRELAVGLMLGALIYVPLALWEIRMSPQLHAVVYGYYPSAMLHNIRLGGFRPVVFMQTALMTGFFLGAGALVGVWMYYTGALRRLWGVQLLGPVVVLVITALLSKAVAAICLTIAGVGALWSVRNVRTGIAIWVLVLVPVFYVGARSTGVWDGAGVVAAVGTITESRARSLEFRFEHETRLADRAWERPLLGWGRMGDARVRDAQGRDRSVTDGLWIITFGNHGLLAVTALVVVLALPSVLLLWRCRLRWWSDPRTAPVAALAVVPLLFAADSMLNAMVNPVWTLIIGGLGAYYLALPRRAQSAGVGAGSGRQSPARGRARRGVGPAVPGGGRRAGVARS